MSPGASIKTQSHDDFDLTFDKRLIVLFFDAFFK